jgi:hypothetical protein
MQGVMYIMMPNMLIPKGIPENVTFLTLLKQKEIGQYFLPIGRRREGCTTPTPYRR